MSRPVEAVTDHTARRLRWRLATAQSEGQVPSIVAGIVRDGGLAWAEGVGDVPGEVTDTQYKVGSITKTLTAVLVLQLVDEGRLSLDAPASEVLGEVGYADRSIRQLLAHTGGLQAEPSGSWWERTEGATFDELVAANDGTTPAFDADRRFHYSNLGYGLLGEVVARLRGQTWWEAVEQRILVPLGMTRTSYQASGAHALGWSVHPYAQTLIPEPLPDTAAMAPAGQVWSTVADLATYCTFLLEGHDDVLPAARLAEAFTPQAGEEATGLRYAHGLGFQVFPGGAGTLVGPQRLHARLPRHLPRRPHPADGRRRPRQRHRRGAGGGVRRGAARRARAVRAHAAAGLATQRERADGARGRAGRVALGRDAVRARL